MSVEFGIITSVVPPGSWHFPQLLSTGQSVRITGDSFELLLENMLDFRRRHSDLCGGAERATIEMVRSDLKDYFCKHFRQNCGDAASAPTTQIGIGVTNYVTPINKAADWLAAVGGVRPDYVDAALAAQRAQICATCPQNVHWQTPCGPCNQNIAVRTLNAKGSLQTPYDRNLGVCRIYGHMNEVAVWMQDTYSHAEQPAPSVCWKVQHK